jgi:hypothetical protein
MVSDDPCSAPEDKRRVLLDHWEEIPAVVLIEASGKVFKSHPVREAILAILREGIEEEQAERGASDATLSAPRRSRSSSGSGREST